MKTVREFLKQNQILLLTWLTGILLVYQVMNLHSYVVATVDHQSMVASNDDDAGMNVAKTIKTRWWKDNGWVLYGPAYFRLNHTINYFWGRTADPLAGTPNENWERTAHHAVMTTSLLSVVALSLLISCLLLTPWWQRFLCTIGLNAALTGIPAYAEFILRAHPDMLFAFVCAAAMFFTIQMLREPEQKLWYWLSATIWGFTVSIKMTVSLCAPGFVLLFIPPFNKMNFKRGLKYLGIMFLSYFLIGFPQTIVLDRPFREMRKIGGLSAPVGWDSISNWLSLYGQHLWPVLLVIALASLDFEKRKWSLPRKGAWRIWAFVLLPFAVLLTKNMMVPAAHYTVAFVAMFAVVFAMFFPFPTFIKRNEYPLLRGALFFALILAVFGSTPTALQAQLEKRLDCRKESRDFYSRAHEFYNQGLNVWVDPYLPYVNGVPKDRVEVTWEKTWSGYERGNWNVMAFNRHYMLSFIAPGAPNDYTKTDIPGWKPVQEFYLAFKDGDEAKSPQGHVFKKVFQNSCGHELWLRQ